MNEAHSGLARCLRTRELGRELLPIAHARGVRHLAMEALSVDLAARCLNMLAELGAVPAGASQRYLSAVGKPN